MGHFAEIQSCIPRHRIQFYDAGVRRGVSALLLREGAQLLGWTTLAALALVCAGIWAVNAAPRKTYPPGGSAMTCEELLQIASRIGRGLLESGAEAYRVENSVHYVIEATIWAAAMYSRFQTTCISI